MPIIGLTGGVATGKSTFTKLFARELVFRHFDADLCVHDLLARDEAVGLAIADAFGPSVLSLNGQPDRLKLRERVFNSCAERRTLEDILHPAVRARWQAQVAESRKSDAWQLIDLPLLYETGVQGEFDRVIVIAAHRVTQMRRLTNDRAIAPPLAERIIAAQMDLGAKIQQADHVIWNDSTVSNLDGQSRLLAAWLRRNYA